MSRRPRISNGHVIWAYEHILHAYRGEGLSPGKIRDKLREDHCLHVGVDAIKAVLGNRSNP